MENKEKNRYWTLPSIIFNLVETLLLVGMAWLLKIGWVNLCIIFFVFEISRFYFKFPKHYKAWQQCLIWTLLLFTSIFIVARVDITVGVLNTIFCAYIVSEKSNIKDLYMWSGKKTQYQDIIDFIKYNSLSDKVLEFEKRIQDQDMLSYMIYKYRFKDQLSFQEISKKLEIETQRITEVQEKVAFSFRTFVGL